MTDKELVNFLITQTGSTPLASRALGVTRQRLRNWRQRGIPYRYRFVFLTVANRHGAELPLSWLDASVPSVLEQSTPRGRKTNGRASTKQRAQKAQGEGGKRTASGAG